MRLIEFKTKPWKQGDKPLSIYVNPEAVVALEPYVNVSEEEGEWTMLHSQGGTIQTVEGPLLEVAAVLRATVVELR